MRSNSVVSGLAIALISLPVPALAAKTGITDCQIISESDSYVLKNNLPGGLGLLTGTNAGSCLVIEADSVGISMAGYTITGTDTNPSFGITDGGTGRRGIDVSGGNITNFGIGIDLAASSNATVEGMRLMDNGGGGIFVGSRSVVTGNIVDAEPPRITGGIDAGFGSRVATNLVSNSLLVGIVVAEDSSVRGNNVRLTGGQFPDFELFAGPGITVTCPSSVSGNSVTGTFAEVPPLSGSGVFRDIELLTANGACFANNNLGNIVEP